MADEGFKRKLTAILSADEVGYSRLMEDDETATVRTLTSYREVITTLIKQHNGMVVDSPGDNLLAEFVSVVDAVQCAVSVQNEISARNEDLPEHRKMQFRIGINLGDVILEGEALVSKDLVAFWGGADWESGEIVEVGHDARGKNVAGKVLVFPIGKGGGSETFGYYYLGRSGKAPKVLVCNRSLGQTIAGALLMGTPMIYGFKEDITAEVKTGDWVRVDTDRGEVEVLRKAEG